MDYQKLQEIALGDTSSAEGEYEGAEGEFENARGKKARQAKRASRKAGRQAKRADRRGKRQEKRAKRVEKRNPAKATRLKAKAQGNRAKSSSLKSVKTSLNKKAKVKQSGDDVEIAPLETDEGNLQPMINENEAYTPQVVSPIEEGNEIIEPEIADSGEVLTPEIVETNEEPIENENGSIEVGEETIEPEQTDSGESYEPEVVSEEEGADGETVYRILKYNKIPATRSADGNVIMPYKMADGSVVLTDNVYSSATGEIYKNAEGDTVVRSAKLKGAKEGDININFPDNKWVKYAVWATAVIGATWVGFQIWKAVKKK